jgi:hypothetical protein
VSDISLKPSELKLLEFLGQATGCDIWNYGDAIDGRALQKHGLVDIGKAQKPPKNGADRQPYYGLSINEAGRTWLAASGILFRGTGVA